MERASTTRIFHFTTKGGSLTAIWMGDRGDIYQEYSESGGSTTYYPDITSSQNTITMSLTITSAYSTTPLTPQSVTYYANNTELTFTGVNCTNSGWEDIFKLTQDGMLQIIGNIGKVAQNTSFLLKAVATVSTAAGSDTITVTAPVTISPYTGGSNARVTIAPGDNKNFTISEKQGSCQLKALVTKGGAEVTTGLTYEWYKFGSGNWAQISNATAQTLTVNETDVDTYSLFKVIVRESGTELGFDTQGVLDASDPYDIIVSTAFNDGLSGASNVATNDLTISDDMDDAAYLLFTCSLTKRGSNTALSGMSPQWTFTIVAGNGAALFGQAQSSSNSYKLTKKNVVDYGAGIGDYEIVFECEV